MEGENFEKNEVRIDNNPDKRINVSEMKNNISDVKEKITKNPWMVSTIVVGIIALILLIMMFTGGGITGNVVSANIAADNLLEFANAQGAEAELVEVNDIGDFYEVIVTIQGQDMPLYVTKDGEAFTQSLIPLTGNVVQQDPQAQEPIVTEYSEEDLLKINEFAQCLADEGVKVYGANWCGYTMSLVENFGDFETMAPIYLECTENEAECAEAGVSGYPTIKINGEVASIARTLVGFADATGCDAPDVGVQVSTNVDAGC